MNNMNNNHIELERLELGPWKTNSYIINCRTTGDSILFDAPANAAEMIRRLDGTNPKYLLLTHTHMDHIGALSELRDKLRIPIGAHAGGVKMLPFSPDILLTDGETISFGNKRLKVLHTPGHTPGSLCFHVDNLLISGDTIFPGGPGRTDTPVDFRRIVESITNKIFILPDDTALYPGHGESTNVGTAKEEYAYFNARSHRPGLCGSVLWKTS